MKSLNLLAALTLALLASGCNSTSNEEEETSPDKLRFVSVGTSGNLVDGDTILVMAIVEYELVSKDSAELNFGFNNMSTPATDLLVDSATRIVGKGTGLDTIRFSGVVRNWGSRSDFHVHANLSPYPHSTLWNTLVETNYVLIPKK